MLSSFPWKAVLATWYGPSSFIGGGHPSWPLEGTGYSEFFKLVHCGKFVAVISSNPYALCAGGNTVLSISRLGWAWPTPNFPDDTESGCISVQSYVFQTYWEVCF